LKSPLIILAVVCLLAVAAFFVFHGARPPHPVVQKQAEGPAGDPELTWITGLAESHDGHVLATVNDNKTVALWDAATGTNLRALESGSNEWVFAPAFSPDDSLLVTAESSGGSDTHGSLLLWNPSTGERLGSVENLPWPNSVTFNPAGTLIAVGGTPTLYLVDPSTKEITHKVERAHENGAIQAIGFSPNGDLLATAGRDGTVKLWQVPELNLVRTLSVGPSVQPTHPSEGPPARPIVGSVTFAHHHPRLAASTTEGTVIVWDFGSGREIVRYRYDDAVATAESYMQATVGNSLSFTSDDRWLLTTDLGTNGVRLLSADSKKQAGGLLSTQAQRTIEALNVSPADGSVAFAYREFAGEKAHAKFEIWKLQLR
jgi:WD40 repeat protein